MCFNLFNEISLPLLRDLSDYHFNYIRIQSDQFGFKIADVDGFALQLPKENMLSQIIGICSIQPPRFFCGKDCIAAGKCAFMINGEKMFIIRQQIWIEKLAVRILDQGIERKYFSTDGLEFKRNLRIRCRT
jgi:hypothetical protein